MSTVSIAILIERSHGTIVLSFSDRERKAFTPKTLFWTLTDADGKVINDRNKEQVTDLDPEVEILLKGKDLLVRPDETLDAVKQPKGQFSEAISKYLASRFFIVEGTYDDITLGNDIPFTTYLVFPVEQLITVKEET